MSPVAPRSSRLQLVTELRRLKEAPEDFDRRLPDLFVLWFVLAYSSDDRPESARSALTGVSKDRGIDAVLIDRKAKSVLVVQGKLRDEVGRNSEAEEDVLAFTDVARALWGSQAEFREFCDPRGMDPLVGSRLREARDSMRRARGYQLELVYATLGRFTERTTRTARQRVGRISGDTKLRLLDGNAVLRLLDNYLDGVAHVPPITVPIEPAARGSASNIVRADSGLESWLFTMSADSVAAMVERAGEAIFARNIRIGLGETPVNKDIRASLADAPELFWYLNNGITIICDSIERRGARAERLEVINAQIINGQQTARTLHAASKAPQNRAALRRANVLLRLVQVPPTGPVGQSFEGFVSSIVQSTNWQNKISASDLRANDRRQILLQRQLRRFGYEYMRKRGKKRDLRNKQAGLPARVLTKFELAQAVAGCEFPMLPLRVGKEPLFESRYYPAIFGTDDVYFYLTRLWLADSVRRRLRGQKARRAAQWLVVAALWTQIGPEVRRARDVFREVANADSPPLQRMIDSLTSAALAFYSENRRIDDQALQLDTFFKREFLADAGAHQRPLYPEFERFWRSPENARRRVTFEQARQRLVGSIAMAAETA